MHFPDMTSHATSSDKRPRLFVSGNTAKDVKYSSGGSARKSRTVHHYGLRISSTFNPGFYLLILTLLCPDFFRVLGNSRIEFPVQQGTGVVTATMYLYQDANYATVFNGVPVLTTADMLYIKIALDTVLNGVYIIAKQCWATPDEDGILSPQRFDIIEPPGCLKNSVTKGALTSNGISEESRFQLQVFQFLPFPVVYLHCQVQLCTPTATGSCQPLCNGNRRRRKRDLGETKLMTSQLIIRSEDGRELVTPPNTPVGNTTNEDTSNSDTFEVTILLPVLLGLVLVLILAIIGLFVWIYMRNRRGK